jgi:hypothetical protein
MFNIASNALSIVGQCQFVDNNHARRGGHRRGASAFPYNPVNLVNPVK